MSIREIKVLYDGACPQCVKDRQTYERLCNVESKGVVWFDITNQDAHLKKLGIDPIDAMLELHVILDNQTVIKSIDAYILLFKQIWFCWPLAQMMTFAPIKRYLHKWYQNKVKQRLIAAGRLNR